MTSGNVVVAVVAADAVTAACGLLNGAYFLRQVGVYSSRARRAAAAVLALVNAAAVTEAVFSEWLLWSSEAVMTLGPQSPALWALLRLPLFAATGAVSVIILRRLLS
ncbi:MAG: hypothetical protein Q8S13_02420 [Dehalococcoidia bacterium]|nr:hypothetical protein [Dehalococcoidia bacterium]